MKLETDAILQREEKNLKIYKEWSILIQKFFYHLASSHLKIKFTGKRISVRYLKAKASAGKRSAWK